MKKFPPRGINPAVRARRERSRIEWRIVSNIKRYGREFQGDEIAVYKAKKYFEAYKEILKGCDESTRKNYVKLFDEDIEKYREKSTGAPDEVIPKFQVFGRNCYIVGRAIDEEMNFEIDSTGHFKIDGKVIENLDEYKFGERRLGKDVVLEEDEETLPRIDY